MELELFGIRMTYYLNCKKSSDDYGKIYLKYVTTNGLTLIQDDIELKLDILKALESFEPDAYEIYVVEEVRKILTEQP